MRTIQDEKVKFVKTVLQKKMLYYIGRHFCFPSYNTVALSVSPDSGHIRPNFPSFRAAEILGLMKVDLEGLKKIFVGEGVCELPNEHTPEFADYYRLGSCGFGDQASWAALAKLIGVNIFLVRRYSDMSCDRVADVYSRKGFFEKEIDLA